MGRHDSKSHGFFIHSCGIYPAAIFFNKQQFSIATLGLATSTDLKKAKGIQSISKARFGSKVWTDGCNPQTEGRKENHAANYTEKKKHYAALSFSGSFPAVFFTRVF
jgi:hypothetical protein